MLGTRRSNLSRPKRAPSQQHMKTSSEEDASFDGVSAIPLFYIPKNKYICHFDNNNNVNLKNNSDLTSVTSFITPFSYETLSEDDGDESTTQYSKSVVMPATSSKTLTQIAAEKIKEGRYSHRMNECELSKTTETTTKSSSTSSTATSSSTTYPKLPSTVLKYMFKCDGGKAGEKTVSNDDTPVVITTKRGTASAIVPDACDESISSRTTISTLSSRSRRSKKFHHAKRIQILDTPTHASNYATSASATSAVPSKKTKEPITIVASMGRGHGGGGYMIPIDEMNDLAPFDEENGVELQLVEDHAYYLSKITNEISEHQRRVEMELRKSRRARHRSSSGMSHGSGGSSSSISSRSMEITRTPSEADF